MCSELAIGTHQYSVNYYPYYSHFILVESVMGLTSVGAWISFSNLENYKQGDAEKLYKTII